MDDGKGRKRRLCLWNHPGNDIIGRNSLSKGTITSVLFYFQIITPKNFCYAFKKLETLTDEKLLESISLSSTDEISTTSLEIHRTLDMHKTLISYTFWLGFAFGKDFIFRIFGLD